MITVEYKMLFEAISTMSLVALVAVGLMLVIQKHREHEWLRQKLSAEFILRWNTNQQMKDSLNKVIIGIQHISPIDFFESDHRDSGLMGDWLTLMNFFEEASIATNTNLASEEYLRSFLQSTLVLIFKLSEKHIHHLREKSNDPHVFANVEVVAWKWQKSLRRRVVAA